MISTNEPTPPPAKSCSDQFCAGESRTVAGLAGDENEIGEINVGIAQLQNSATTNLFMQTTAKWRGTEKKKSERATTEIHESHEARVRPHLDELLAEIHAICALARDELGGQTEGLRSEWLHAHTENRRKKKNT